MKILKPQTIEVVSDISCDSCGVLIAHKDHIGPEYATLQAHWGYYSDHDMRQYELEICEKCFFAIIEKFKNKPYLECI